MPSTYSYERPDLDLANAVNRVKSHASFVKDATEELTMAVNKARQAGASWSDIGEAAGMSRQAAHKRWSGKD
jgi:hypothetical protein